MPSTITLPLSGFRSVSGVAVPRTGRPRIAPSTAIGPFLPRLLAPPSQGAGACPEDFAGALPAGVDFYKAVIQKSGKLRA